MTPTESTANNSCCRSWKCYTLFGSQDRTLQPHYLKLPSKRQTTGNTRSINNMQQREPFIFEWYTHVFMKRALPRYCSSGENIFQPRTSRTSRTSRTLQTQHKTGPTSSPDIGLEIGIEIETGDRRLAAASSIVLGRLKHVFHWTLLLTFILNRWLELLLPSCILQKIAMAAITAALSVEFE